MFGVVLVRWVFGGYLGLHWVKALQECAPGQFIHPETSLTALGPFLDVNRSSKWGE